jgi:Dolichyl-phosphate-mannose-protein mannosyltransferase
VKRAFIAFLFAAFFFYCAGFGLRTHFGYDDVMNIDFAWEPPLRDLALGLAVPFTTFYRPVGSLAYRVIFDIFGLNPSPFRVVVYGFLLLNLWLVYKLAARVSGSREVGAMSALLYTFHGRLAGIYLNNGTIYDVLCATLTFLTLLYYIGVRQAGGRIQGWAWLKFLALFICALNAKEMAAAVPVLLLVYEWLYHKPVSMRPALVCGALVLLAARSRAGEGSVMHGNVYYAMTFTGAQFLEHWRRLMSDLLYVPNPGLNIAQMLAVWAVVIAIAAVARKKYLWFFLWFAWLTPLPVLFIPYRGFFVMYLPFAGWAMFAATLLVGGRNWLWAHVWKRPALSANAFEPERIFLFLAVAYFVAVAPRHDSASELGFQDPAQEIIRAMRRDIVGLNEPLPKGARLLFLHDRFPPDAFGPLMMSRQLYRDRTLWVDRPAMMSQAPNLSDYDRVFDYVDGKFAVVGGKAGGRDKMLRPR